MAGELSASRALVPAHAPAAPSRWLRLRPPAIARALTMVAFSLHGIVFGFESPLGRSTTGGALVTLAGLAWVVWARWTLRRAGTTIARTAVPTMLVDEGPYRFGRNPIYLGTAVAMLGLGLATGVPFMAIAALNFAVIVAAVHIPHEEGELRRTFGGWYSDYTASVRRWL